MEYIDLGLSGEKRRRPQLDRLSETPGRESSRLLSLRSSIGSREASIQIILALEGFESLKIDLGNCGASRSSSSVPRITPRTCFRGDVLGFGNFVGNGGNRAVLSA